MRTSDRKFNIAGKGQDRSSKDQTSSSQYGDGAVQVKTIIDTEKSNKPPTNVQNVNLQEVRRNGVESYKNA
jgi:hypothetical protein